MTLGTEDIAKIMIDVIFERPLRIDTEEAREFAEKIRPGIEEAKRLGMSIDIPD